MLVTVLACCVPATGQIPTTNAAAIKQITFYSEPPRSSVYIPTSSGPYYLGVTGAPVQVATRLLQLDTHILMLHAGFKPYEFVVPGLTFNAQIRWPVTGAVQLEPDYRSSAYWSYEARQQTPTAVVIIALGIISRKRWQRRRRKEEAQLRRAERLETLQSRVLEKHADRSLEGAVLGMWRLLEPVGMGGMATVYRALPDQTLDDREQRAVKVVKKEFSLDTEFRERFKREFELSSRLSHPSTVQVYEMGEHEGYLYLVMEFVSGQTLRDVLQDVGALPLRKALEYLKPVMLAVQAAHEKGIVHRDLKPENVMVLDSGKVKVMDFGLAKKLKQTVKVTATGALLGTPAYMAPEQISSNVLDPSSDQYALGVMLYELLAGRLPFEDENVTNLLFKRLYEDAPRLRTLRPEVAPHIEEGVHRMMEREPRMRFPNLDAALLHLDPSYAAELADRRMRAAAVE